MAENEEFVDTCLGDHLKTCINNQTRHEDTVANYVANKAHQTQLVQQEQLPSQPTIEQFLECFCSGLGTTMPVLRRLFACAPALIECAPKMKTCIPALENFSRCEQTMGNLEAVVARCKSYEHLIYEACCPANALYGDVSRHHYSSKNTLYLDQVVQNVGPNHVNAYPVPSAKIIRLVHLARPGFVPEMIEAHFTLANSGTNYLNIRVQFYVDNEPIGSEFLGSTFLDEDGRTKMVAFPTWRGQEGIKIGSAEKVAVELSVTGPNNLEFATVALHLNAKGWASLCLPPDVCRPNSVC